MIDIPVELAESQSRFSGEAGRAFIAALPGRAADFLERWELRRTGSAMYGKCALVLPVECADGTAAVLKLQQPDDESVGEPVALRAWGGDGAVRLLRYDEETGTLLLERLVARGLGGRSGAGGPGGPGASGGPGARGSGAPGDSVARGSGGPGGPGGPGAGGPVSGDPVPRHLPPRDLSGVPVREAVRILAELLARLTSVQAPAGLRTLGDAVARMLDEAPVLAGALVDEGERRLVRDCAAAVREVADEPGDRLLHWDLHYENVLAAEREPWLAIDPKPLAGDPGFELLPALTNRFGAFDGTGTGTGRRKGTGTGTNTGTGTGSPGAQTLWRFDLMTEVLALDRSRARAWTLGRVLQNCLWRLRDGDRELDPVQVSIARSLLAR
ncbi:aminoglycoside phosphotransferase family protein [Streptomyces sp. GMY02]|uniref:aminoglycoside phosphotransferase family protein n=1 Tax=Streptomyces sp. GMY02 TaxID=1333528 RepID=UPI0020B7D8EA|nr:aminoglycoside phosphotransferase family protein [Streptomyces sp. GMY02]